MAAERNHRLNNVFIAMLKASITLEKKNDIYRTAGPVECRLWNVFETQLQLDHTRTKKAFTITGHSCPTRASISKTPHISLMPIINARDEKGPLLILSKENIAVTNDSTMEKLFQSPG